MAYVKIQDEDLIYDRTRNFSGILDYQGISEIVCPTEGSSVEFLAKDKALTTNNNWLNIMPVGINNVYANYNMVYEAGEKETAELANFLESKKGVEPVLFDTDATLYKPINGYCTSYAITQIDVETFQVSASFEVTEAPGHLNWTGMNFLDLGSKSLFYIQENKKYLKHDIAYDQRLDLIYQDKLNSIFYCLEDHDSSSDNSVNLEESPYWTRDFFWEPDVGQSAQVKLDTQRFGDVDGFPYRRKVKDNTASFPITYNFSEISTQQLKGMLHFLESKNGYRRFKHRISTVFNRPKVFVCRKWTHTWNGFDSHNLEVKFDEDPFGVVPDRVPQNEETLSTRVFKQDGNLLKQIIGDIPDFEFELDSEAFSLKIGAGCGLIGEAAFAGAVNLNGVLNIPGGVSGIGDQAFKDCVGFSSRIIFGGGLSEIGNQAFQGCNQIQEGLVMPPNLKRIGYQAFQGCSSFDEGIELGENLESMGYEAFYGCNKIRGILKIPSSLKLIPYRAFRGCTQLYGNLEIPNGVETISGEAFWNCNTIGTKVILPSGIKGLANNAFRGCNKVYDIYINDPVAPYIGGEPFPIAQMEKLRKIHVPIGGEGYDTAYWQQKDAEGKLVFDIIL
jgi:phage-related protein